MKTFLALLALIWITLGVMLILYTELTRTLLKGLFARVNIRVVAAVPFTIGLVLLVASFSQPEMFWFFLILGSLAVMKGIYLAFGPANQIKNLQAWWFDRAGGAVMRLSGIVSLLLGVIVLCYVLRT